MDRKEVTVSDIAALRAYAEELLASLSSNEERATILALHGDLGAGKTALTQEIARVLGVVEQVTSPTFVIMKSYETGNKNFRRLVHIDAYRIDGASELPPLRLQEVFLEPRTLVCIEWAEKLGDVLPLHARHLTLTSGEGGVRTIAEH